MRPCANVSCENTVSDSLKSDFCFTCMAQLVTAAQQLEREIPNFLALEAEFVDWCREHGHPNPHE